MNKGQLMKKIYTEEELKNIDSAIPSSMWSSLDSTSFFVMNYNKNRIFGELEDLRVVAENRKIRI